jgi:hypothetical protein
MNEAFGTIRTVPASEATKKKMKQLVDRGLFKEQRDVWRLGAALGISKRQPRDREEKKRDTFQNINSLDPDGIFAAIMLGLYPDMTPEERINKLVDHAEWGIDEIFHQSDVGTLDFASFAEDVKAKNEEIGEH